MRKVLALVAALGMFGILSCSSGDSPMIDDVDAIAESYVRLLLKVGQYNEDFVDAYCGPEELRPTEIIDTAERKFTYEDFNREVSRLIAKLNTIERRDFSQLEELRFQNLHKQLLALQTGIEMLSGRQFSFDEESRRLYDAVAPRFAERHLDSLVNEFDDFLPGEGDIALRHTNFIRDFIIPEDKLDTVFKVALAEARRRTKNFIGLPDDERFDIAYVEDKPWTGYNWYKGNSRSLIELNTDLPMYIDYAVGLACHEGYPGHHVQNVLFEQELYRGHGWIEYSIYPLFSPTLLIMEGTANYGIEVAFPDEERLAFERDILYPLAGLDPARAEEYHRLQKLWKKIRYTGVEIARRYLDGELPRETAVEWSIKYSLNTPDEAEQAIQFIEKYRSYKINYSLGEDIVRAYIESHVDATDEPGKRWQLLADLFSKPFLPSDLQRLSKTVNQD